MRVFVPAKNDKQFLKLMKTIPKRPLYYKKSYGGGYIVTDTQTAFIAPIDKHAYSATFTILPVGE